MILFETIPVVIRNMLNLPEIYMFDTVGIGIVMGACLLVGCIFGLVLGD